MSREKIEQHLEITAYTHLGVRVLVEIDYDKGTISLLEQPQRNAFKKWIFAGRSVEYMNGWRNILTAMEYAIGIAEKKLQRHNDTVEKEKIALHRAMERAQKADK